MSVDALILGGGPTGASAAFWLARAGRKVLLLEKERQPRHRLCAELIWPDAQSWLQAIGIDLQALGAVPVERLRAIGPWGEHNLPLGFQGFALTRRTLDQAIRQHAEQAGATIQLGQNIRRRQYPDLQQEAGTARILIATGRSEESQARPGRLYLKNYYRLIPDMRAELSRHFELILFEGGYARLQMVEREMSNLTITLGEILSEAATRDPSTFLENLIRNVPHLARRLEGAVSLLDQPLVSQPVSGGAGRQADMLTNQIRLDEAASLGFALHSGRLAAKSVQLGNNDHEIHLARDGRRSLWAANWLDRLLLRLGADDPGANFMGKALFLVPKFMPSLLRHGQISRLAIKRAGTS